MVDFQTGTLFYLIMKLTILKRAFECLGSGESIAMTSKGEQYFPLLGCGMDDLRVGVIFCR